MATILLRAAGTFVGGLLGGPFGAILGATGALAGYAIDQAVFGDNSTRQGPRLNEMPVLNASEGAPIPHAYGYTRLGGQIIWATRFREEQQTERAGGGKGLSRGTRVQTFTYYGNFAVALCEGTIAGVRRIWADGRELDLADLNYRVYLGTETQLPDPFVEALQGVGKTPAYRGTAYVVFEGLPLEEFGNRIPQLSFEVIRPVGKLEPMVEAITIIPGASEFAYATTHITEQAGLGDTRSMNRHVLHGETDWQASLDELQAICPNLKRVALVVSWFGDDLRCENCTLTPRVEETNRGVTTVDWNVGGVSRDQATPVSRIEGKAAFGGTPSDQSVIQAIADMKQRGLEVTFYPFIMMDIPAGSVLPNPDGNGTQATYPWRGRISSGTDRTAACQNAVSQFVGATDSSSFNTSGTIVSTVSQEFSYRRFILHYAHLCSAAGGVDGFVVGTEFRGLTRLRDDSNAFPFVAALSGLIDDIAPVLNADCQITYAADWSEYFGYQPADGSGDVFFNLDPIWAHPQIAAIGIDNYMPLSDWRDTADAAIRDGFESAYDREALASQIEGGEGYDWYYRTDTDRLAGTRTGINSGDLGDEWLYRFKDLEGWWSHQHYDRRNGVAVSTPSAWVPQSKPFWFTELGAPAVDKAANQPNVFPDPKSSENAAPYMSNGGQDALIQRRFLEAHLTYWRQKAVQQSSPMVLPEHIYLWTWDSRPYPAFPVNRNVWSDGSNWHLGHWLNGRLGTAPADDLISEILADSGFSGHDTSRVDAICDGLIVPGDMTARAVLESLIDLWGLQVVQSDDHLTFRSPSWIATEANVSTGEMLDENDQVLTVTRADRQELPGEVSIGFQDVFRDYTPANISAFHSSADQHRNVENLSLSISLCENAARSAAENVLFRRFAERTSVTFALLPEFETLEAGDFVRVSERPD
jgi:hypothetical protein